MTKVGVHEDLFLEQPALGAQNLAFEYKQHQTNPLQPCLKKGGEFGGGKNRMKRGRWRKRKGNEKGEKRVSVTWSQRDDSSMNPCGHKLKPS